MTERDEPPAPPRAPRRPTVLRHVIGETPDPRVDERTDDWYWLREREDPAVREYLEAENAFTQAGLSHTSQLQERVFAEIKARVQETDVSAPVRRRNWEYFTRTTEGHEYAVHCRRPTGATTLPDPAAAPGATAGKEIVLDENALAGDAEYFGLRGFALSPAQALVAYAVDFTGGELATLRFRDLATGLDLEDQIDGVYYGLAWANDERTIFYVRPDDAIRPHQVWRHALGSSASDDVLVYQEDDERFAVGIARSRGGRFLVLGSESKLTSESRLVNADDPTAPPRLVAPREQGVQYHVEPHHDDEHGDRLFIVTNADGAENFKLMESGIDATSRAAWTEVVPHRRDVRLQDVDAFAGHLVLSERAEGLERLRVITIADGAERLLAMPDDVYSAWVGANPEFESTTLRYGYTSLVMPVSDVDEDLTTGERIVVKTQPVHGYDPGEFETHRLWASATDGTKVPISIVHRRDLARDGRAPCLLYGYGSYEISIDPVFSTSRVSLLERGAVFAIAHVRGGGELGRPWYDDGKLDHKQNTFTDFVACAEHLVAEGYTSPGGLVARGGSAGGLLMGAVANLRPDLFRAIVAEVPFVDCLTTMLDDSLPLTITEWEEWGDPVHDPAMYDYIRSYAPCENVTAQHYPGLLVTAGLNDPRVQYWEPAKWVAKLRETATGDAPLFLKTELGTGHHGPSGRYESWREEAFVLAFMLDQMGVSE
ncbi:MAG: S9 family peptidase [Acidimicrobiia bacterium]|nr:S9 family peptidase [Acidimicrobiia bacterium]